MNKPTDGKLSTADLAYGRQDRTEPGTQESMPDAVQQQANSQAEPGSQETTPLFPENDASSYQTRWQDIQIKFVDEPQDSLKEADALVAEVIQKLATRFAEERGKLEGQWSKGSEVSTEDLRQALRHYRSFFQRLLSA